MLLALLLSAAIQITSIEWTAAPASLPAGTKMAVLEGSPKEAGLFTVRFTIPAGASIAMHTHPRAERVTVLSGKLIVSLEGKETTFTGGGFYVTPPNVPHSISFVEETVMQLTCEGPWELKYLNAER